MGQTASSPNFHGKVIECGKYVGHSDVSKFMKEQKFTEEDRRLLQGCYDLFESKPDVVWQNCAIEVYCSSVDVKFVSGDQSNRYILRFKKGDVWTVAMKEEIKVKLYAAYEWLRVHLKEIGDAVGAAIKGKTPLPQIGNK